MGETPTTTLPQIETTVQKGEVIIEGSSKQPESTPKNDTLAARALTDIFLNEQSSDPQIQLVMRTVGQLSNDTRYSYQEKLDPSSLSEQLKNNIEKYQTSVDDEIRTSTGKSILEGCHAAQWNGMTEQVLQSLTTKEMDTIMSLSFQEVARRVADVLGKPGSLTKTLSLAKNEWNLHKDLVIMTETRSFREANPNASDEDINKHTQEATRVAIGKITLSSVSDMLKDNPDWAKSALSSVVNIIFPKIFNQETS